MKKLKTARSLSLGISVLLIILLTTFTLLAASDSATVTVSWNIQPFVALSISSNSTESRTVNSVYSVPKPTEDDLERGYIEKKNAIKLVARSNTGWQVSVRALNSTMGTSFDGSYTKPIEDFKLKVGNGGYLTLSTNDKVLVESRNGEHEIGVDYKINFDQYEYKSGNYQVELLYTITTK